MVPDRHVCLGTRMSEFWAKNQWGNHNFRQSKYMLYEFLRENSTYVLYFPFYFQRPMKLNIWQRVIPFWYLLSWLIPREISELPKKNGSTGIMKQFDTFQIQRMVLIEPTIMVKLPIHLLWPLDTSNLDCGVFVYLKGIRLIRFGTFF